MTLSETGDDTAPDLIAPTDVAYDLHLTAVELKVTHTALHALLDDLGHDERSVGEIVRRVLGKLPDEHSIRAIALP